MDGVSSKQLAQAEMRALCWNGGVHISQVIPTITVESILNLSQEAFRVLYAEGYRSLKKASQVIGYYSRRTDFLFKSEKPGKEQNKLLREVRKLQKAAQKDEILFATRSKVANSREDLYWSTSPILNKLFELAVFQVMDRIRANLVAAGQEHEYQLHYRLIESWVRSIVRFPGNPRAVATLERFMAERIVTTGSGPDSQCALSASLVLSSYLLSLMSDSFSGQLSYARYLINTGKNSVLSKKNVPVIRQCSNHYGCDSMHEEIAIVFLRTISRADENHAFYMIDVDGDNRAYFGMKSNGLITIFGVQMDVSEPLINYSKKLAFKSKDMEILTNTDAAMKEVNFIVGMGLLEDLSLNYCEEIICI